MMHFFEIETKYDATDISLSAFSKSCNAIGKCSVIEVSSFDHYYVQCENPNKFIRHRDGNNPQLTMKEKTSVNNNFKRIEVNLDISKKAKKEVVDQFCKMLGFDHNFSIFKTSTIFQYDKFNTVFYIVYDATKTKELGRFIEIEMSETYKWESELEAWGYLLNIENILSNASTPITSRKRLKKSLFEMYRK